MSLSIAASGGAGPVGFLYRKDLVNHRPAPQTIKDLMCRAYESISNQKTSVEPFIVALAGRPRIDMDFVYDPDIVKIRIL